MDEFRIHTHIIDPIGADERAMLAAFLSPLGLDFEDDVELSAVVQDGPVPIATASLAGDVVKCVGVVSEREGEGAAARAVSAVIAEAEARGRRHLFVYTRPRNRSIFESLGFVTLAAVGTQPDEGVMLLENDAHAFDRWAQSIRSSLPGGIAVGAVVVNCNPFTLGHRYLIERSAADCAALGGTLLVLVVAGDRSSFPGAVREALVRAGTADLDNVVVASGGAYCVSGATFPAYYLKEKSQAADLQAALDAELFASRIAPALGIRRRFVGTEPYCQVTAGYNRAMADVLPRHGLELVQIPRVESGGAAISASSVRAAIRDGDLERALALVPPTTAAWLRSAEAEPVLDKIRTGSGRH
ncbi:MAG TPA: [citrate (pro-3S)-lyase] ligase [bacterium]|nr:[citrate (pro-3S)-lyase] ligase [bacterium]